MPEGSDQAAQPLSWEPNEWTPELPLGRMCGAGLTPLPKGTGSGKSKTASKWKDTDVSRLLDRDKRRILGNVMKIAIINVFRHHMYQFNGRTYRQSAGGPIGLRLTSVVAHVVMDSWARGFLEKMVRAEVDVHAFIKYVDDVNLVLSMLAPGFLFSTFVFYEESMECYRRVYKGRFRRTHKTPVLTAIAVLTSMN